MRKTRIHGESSLEITQMAAAAVAVMKNRLRKYYNLRSSPILYRRKMKKKIKRLEQCLNKNKYKTHKRSSNMDTYKSSTNSWNVLFLLAASSASIGLTYIVYYKYIYIDIKSTRVHAIIDRDNRWENKMRTIHNL